MCPNGLCRAVGWARAGHLRHRRVTASRRRRLEVSRLRCRRAGKKMPRGVPQRQWRVGVDARESKAEDGPGDPRAEGQATEHGWPGRKFGLAGW